MYQEIVNQYQNGLAVQFSLTWLNLIEDGTSTFEKAFLYVLPG